MSPRFSIRPLSAQADARLAELARAGDERAFEVLVRRHRRALSAYCRGIGLPEHRVEDVLQQSLTKAWLALARGAEVREPRAWLYRIVHNTAINTIRAERRDACESIEAVPMAEMPHAAGEIDVGLHARDALGHVAALPEQQRQAITLTALQGHSHEHTAGLLGVSDTAVRGLIYRARTTLRKAAAALSPQGLLGLLARTSSESGTAERTAELSAAGGAAAGAGILGKGLLASAVAGLLAAGGTVVGLQGHAMRSRAHHHAAALAAGRSDAPAPIASAGARADRFLSPAIDAQGGRPVGRRDASGLHEGLRRGDGSRHRDDSARGEGLLPGRDGGRGDGRPRSSQRDGNSGGADSSTRSASGDASGSSGTSDGGRLSGATFEAARTTTDDHSGGSGTSGGSASSDSSGGSTAIQSGSTSGDGGSGSSGGGGTGSGSGSGDAEALAASELG